MQLVQVAWLAVVGCAVRLLLHWGFEQAPSNPALYTDLPANLLGCAIMGWAVAAPLPRRLWLREMQPGLTRGFCGTLTSFSSWMVASVAAALGCGGNVWCWLTVLYQLFSSWFACEAAFRGGLLLARWQSGRVSLPHETERVALATLRPPPWLPWACLAAVLAGSAAWMAAQPGPFPAALLFAPLGACLRVTLWQLGDWRGTAAANVAACLLSSVAVLMWGGAGQSGVPAVAVGGARLPDMALLAAALSFGFCGGLSTVSSLMNETHQLRLPLAAAYWLGTVAAALAVCFVILAPAYVLIGPF